MESITATDLIRYALQKPETERARIAETLLASLDKAPGQEVERAWQTEVARRVQGVDSGEVECLPWEAVRDRLYRNAQASD
ncbi:MAG: addiction module protein [Armatimonadetes bacterium]|nr:addiction module protein [Armatimonadota bacterium]